MSDVHATFSTTGPTWWPWRQGRGIARIITTGPLLHLFAMSDNIKNGRKSFTQFRLVFFPTTKLKFKMSILFNGACILYDCEGETPV